MQALDRLLDEVLPICRQGERSPDNYHFDPGTLIGATRYDVPRYLEWLHIPHETLLFENIYIHAGLEHEKREIPAKLERRVVSGREAEFCLHLNNDLYISRRAVRAAIAHELTHLFLIVGGHQRMHEQNTAFRAGDPEEVRTEVAAIALGFGKIVLSGLDDYSDKAPGKQLGYLSLPEFRHVYERVNDLVGVPRSHAEYDPHH
jgi:hypothetical protein